MKQNSLKRLYVGSVGEALSCVRTSCGEMNESTQPGRAAKRRCMSSAFFQVEERHFKAHARAGNSHLPPGAARQLEKDTPRRIQCRSKLTDV